jgi:hypothetical protein
MAELADVFAHLGPAATPILGFLNAKEAQCLLALSKETDLEVASRVIAYQNRWGFKQPAFTYGPDGRFTMRSGTKSVHVPPLQGKQYLSFNCRSFLQRDGVRMGYIYIENYYEDYYDNNDRQIFSAPVQDIRRIKAESLQFRIARHAQIKAEAAAAAAAAAAAEEAAKAKAVADHIAKYTIRAPPAPKENPWLVRAAAAAAAAKAKVQGA